MFAKAKAFYLQDDLFKPTSIVFIASLFVHLCNLLYWFFMVRFLSPVSYGRLNRIISFYTIITPFLGIIQPVITKYVSEFSASDKWESIKFLFFHFLKRILIFGTCFCLIILFFRSQIAGYLNLNSNIPILFLVVGFFLSLFPPLFLGLLQGLQRFLSLSINSIANVASKLIFSLFYVGMLGFGANAALAAFFIGSFVSIGLGFYQLPKNVFGVAVSHLNLDLSSAYRYFIPVGASSFCFTALFNMDVVLVGHYFSEAQTGFYSIAQIVGKIIFFLPSALAVVMFSKAAFAHAQNKETVHILIKNLKFAIVILLAAGAFILFFPGFSIKILTGKFFPECIPLVRLFVIAMSFFALSFIMLQFFLSIHSLKFVWIVAGFALVEFILINLFHKDLKTVLFVLCFISFTLFIIGLSILKETKIRNKI